VQVYNLNYVVVVDLGQWLQKVTTSTLVEGPPKSLSECLSLETSFNDTYKKDEKIACAIWLDDSVGCSWHKEADILAV
jgi:hypothetical protein